MVIEQRRTSQTGKNVSGPIQGVQNSKDNKKIEICPFSVTFLLSLLKSQFVMKSSKKKTNKNLKNFKIKALNTTET